MLSPAKAHRLRQSAAMAVAQEAGQAQMGEAYQLMKAALVEDKRRLHDVQSIERKIELKRQLLPQYRPYIDGVIAGASGVKDDVFSLLMLWTIDVGDMPQALKMGAYALEHSLPAPDAHKRSMACLIAEEIAEHYLKQFGARSGTVHDLDILDELDTLTRGHDMPDPVRAKLSKAIGLANRDFGTPHAAIAYLERALELDARAGVKKDIAALKKLVGE